MKVNKNESGKFQPLENVDRAIHEPARLMLMAYLYVVEYVDFVFLMNQTGLTRGNLSSHMSKLEAAGYVSIEKKFVGKIPRTIYKLTDKGRKALRNYKKSMKQVIADLPG